MTTASIARPASLPRVAQLLRLSGLIAAAGVALLLGMFAAFAAGATDTALVLGRINDALILVAYLLAAPGVLAVHALVRPGRPVTSALLATLGIAALLAIVVLQGLLVAGSLTFEEQVGPVTVALLALGCWFVAVGYLGSADRTLPRGVRMGIVAATYVGYPIWAFWLARRLLAAGSTGA